MIKNLIIFSVLFLIFAQPSMASEPDPFGACHVKGSTTLYDMKHKHWYKTDKIDADRRTLPASTFKIFHSLIALDMQATTPDEVFQWDGQRREIAAWNQDTAFKDAFKNSTVWVYEELAQRITKEDYKRYLHWANYAGNGDIDHGKNGNFWVAGNWGISPLEQIDMLVKLYNNQLPFSRGTMNTVKEFMQSGNNVYGKTGWTRDKGEHFGWWIGYQVFNDRAPLFFVTRIVKNVNEPVDDFAECRKSITGKIMDKYLRDN